MEYRMNGAYGSPSSVLKRRLRFWWLVLAVPVSVAFGQANDAGRSASTGEPALANALAADTVSGENDFSSSPAPKEGESFAEFVHEMESGTPPEKGVAAGRGATREAAAAGKSRLKVGMSLEEALKVLGKDPDSQSEIGAACGKFNVLTWDEDGTRLISVDGTISSVYDGKEKPQK